MQRLIVVAHTESIHHVERRVGGGYDTDLTPRGRRQASAVADALAATLGPRPAGSLALLCSPLRRAAQTAEVIGARLDTSPEFDPDLREIGCGVAEGRPVAWLEARYRPFPDGSARLDHQICEGAETRRSAAARIFPAVARLRDDPRNTGIVVTHGFAHSFVVAAWLNLPAEVMAQTRFRTEPGAITTLEAEPGGEFTLRALAEASHLAGVS